MHDKAKKHEARTNVGFVQNMLSHGCTLLQSTGIFRRNFWSSLFRYWQRLLIRKNDKYVVTMPRFPRRRQTDRQNALRLLQTRLKNVRNALRLTDEIFWLNSADSGRCWSFSSRNMVVWVLLLVYEALLEQPMIDRDTLNPDGVIPYIDYKRMCNGWAYSFQIIQFRTECINHEKSCLEQLGYKILEYLQTV